MLRIFYLLALAPLTALAQAAAAPTYTLISPFGAILSGSVDITKYLQGIIVVIISVAGVLAVVMIVVCGIKMMLSGSVSGKSEAKECIWNAIFGLLIAIAAWALLFTINPDLLKNNLILADLPVPVASPVTPKPVERMPTIPGWYFRLIDTNDPAGSEHNSPKFDTSEACVAVLNSMKRDPKITIIPVQAGGGTVECFQVVAPPPGTTPPPPPPAGTPPPPPPPVAAPPVGGGSETAAREFLCGNNSCVGSKPIGVNRNACVGTSIATGFHCTNLAGLPQDTLQTIKGLTGGGNIIVTGGTENGHSSHGPNLPVFDVAKTSALVSFIKTNASVKNNPSFCTNSGASCHFKWLYNGYWYTDEDAAHFHVCKAGTVAPPGKNASLFKKACTQI